MRRGYGAATAESGTSTQMLKSRSISLESVSKEVTNLTSVSPFRGARSGASDRVLHSWNTAPAARHRSTIAFGATTKTSLASVGHARRTPGVPARAASEPTRRGVCAFRQSQPQSIREVGFHLRAEEAPFRQGLAAALALKGEIRRACGIKKHDGFARQRAILRRAKRQNVDTGAPCHVGRRRFSGNERVGEARAVHMHANPIAVSDRGEFGDLVDAVDRSGFGRLGKRKRARLRRTSRARAETSLGCPAGLPA